MRKVILLLGIFTLFSGSSLAQHCPFDYAHIMVVRITSSTDTVVIPNLKITLLDSLGNTVMTQKYNGNAWLPDTVFLWQNPQHTTHNGIIDNENPMNPWKIRFWFAEDNYVFVGGSHLSLVKLRIEDEDGEANGGHFQTKIIDLPVVFLYPLCTHFSHWDLASHYSFVENYQPILVTLDQK